ncbi:hypothetical protein HYH02_005598 [Chlamydomonas schloesseri]|uniref:Scytovirin-like domain-containing protein n=1 Tax=Chlamydomonas schloesseri TaxID=2026947 RepID=A0A836B6X2_9CHLO|nr:hypothetical protein HYH02_005598 [Chlamydomonas schloesseri]|eukprot:KAG2449451.1 hypothetical protein HYH02_005598 [Chlamydomonas schloesseri]
MDGTYRWNEMSTPAGPSTCTDGCQCDGNRTCSSSGVCETTLANDGTYGGTLPAPLPPARLPPAPHASDSSSSGKTTHPTNLIAGVAFAAAMVLVLCGALIAICYGRRRLQGKTKVANNSLSGVALPYLVGDRTASAGDEESAEVPGFAYFAAASLSAATASFSLTHLIGKLSPPEDPAAAVGYCGGGDAYVGWLPQGVIDDHPQGRNVAVWRLAWYGAFPQAPGAPEAALSHLDATARRLAALRHPHLLPVLGSCPDLPLLVYDLGVREVADFSAPLADVLQPPPAAPGGGFRAPPLGWQARIKVGEDVAAALVFLHERTPPMFCGVPLDVGRVVVDMATGAARLGFVGVSACLAAAAGHGAAPETGATQAREMEDVRALGVLLLRLLVGNVAGEAEALVGWVRGVLQYPRGDGGIGMALAGLALAAAARDGSSGSITCGVANSSSYSTQGCIAGGAIGSSAAVGDGGLAGGGAVGGRAGGSRGTEWPPEVALFLAELALRCASCTLQQGGVPDLRYEILPQLHQLRHHQRLPTGAAAP